MRSALACALACALALVALAVAACGPGSLDDVRFDHREALSGFDLALPAGKHLRDRRGATDGEVIVQARSAVVTLSWQPGRIAAADLPTFGRTAMEAIGATTGGAAVEPLPLELAAPDYGVELAAPTDKGAIMVMTLVQCAHANVTVWMASMASADRARALRFHARFRSTLRCRQDGPPLGVDTALPAFAFDDGIAYLPGSDPPSYYAITGERWHVTPGSASQRAAFEKPEAVARLFAGLGLPVKDQHRLPDRGPWMFVTLMVDIDGEPGRVMLGTLGCPDGSGYTVVYIDTVDLMAATDPAPLERVSCPTAPVDAATLPAVPARFTAACDGGDARACLLYAGLAEEEPALLHDVDAPRLRARACALGLRDACP